MPAVAYPVGESMTIVQRKKHGKLTRTETLESARERAEREERYGSQLYANTDPLMRALFGEKPSDEEKRTQQRTLARFA